MHLDGYKCTSTRDSWDTEEYKQKMAEKKAKEESEYQEWKRLYGTAECGIEKHKKHLTNLYNSEIALLDKYGVMVEKEEIQPTKENGFAFEAWTARKFTSLTGTQEVAKVYFCEYDTTEREGDEEIAQALVEMWYDQWA